MKARRGLSMTDSAPRAGRREGIGLAVLALPAFVIALDFSVLNLAVPVISQELAPSATQLLWIVDIYGFILAGFLIIMGTLGDRIGRRRLLTLGAGGGDSDAIDVVAEKHHVPGGEAADAGHRGLVAQPAPRRHDRSTGRR